MASSVTHIFGQQQTIDTSVEVAAIGFEKVTEALIYTRKNNPALIESTILKKFCDAALSYQGYQDWVNTTEHLWSDEDNKPKKELVETLEAPLATLNAYLRSENQPEIGVDNFQEADFSLRLHFLMEAANMFTNRILDTQTRLQYFTLFEMLEVNCIKEIGQTQTQKMILEMDHRLTAANLNKMTDIIHSGRPLVSAVGLSLVQPQTPENEG